MGKTSKTTDITYSQTSIQYCISNLKYCYYVSLRYTCSCGNAPSKREETGNWQFHRLRKKSNSVHLMMKV